MIDRDGWIEMHGWMDGWIEMNGWVDRPIDR